DIDQDIVEWIISNYDIDIDFVSLLSIIGHSNIDNVKLFLDKTQLNDRRLRILFVSNFFTRIWPDDWQQLEKLKLLLEYYDIPAAVYEQFIERVHNAQRYDILELLQPSS